MKLRDFKDALETEIKHTDRSGVHLWDLVGFGLSTAEPRPEAEEDTSDAPPVQAEHWLLAQAKVNTELAEEFNLGNGKHIALPKLWKAQDEIGGYLNDFYQYRERGLDEIDTWQRVLNTVAKESKLAKQVIFSLTNDGTLLYTLVGRGSVQEMSWDDARLAVAEICTMAAGAEVRTQDDLLETEVGENDRVLAYFSLEGAKDVAAKLRLFARRSRQNESERLFMHAREDMLAGLLSGYATVEEPHVVVQHASGKPRVEFFADWTLSLLNVVGTDLQNLLGLPEDL